MDTFFASNVTTNTKPSLAPPSSTIKHKQKTPTTIDYTSFRSKFFSSHQCHQYHYYYSQYYSQPRPTHVNFFERIMKQKNNSNGATKVIKNKNEHNLNNKLELSEESMRKILNDNQIIDYDHLDQGKNLSSSLSSLSLFTSNDSLFSSSTSFTSTSVILKDDQNRTRRTSSSSSTTTTSSLASTQSSRIDDLEWEPILSNENIYDRLCDYTNTDTLKLTHLSSSMSENDLLMLYSTNSNSNRKIKKRSRKSGRISSSTSSGCCSCQASGSGGGGGGGGDIFSSNDNINSDNANSGYSFYMSNSSDEDDEGDDDNDDDYFVDSVYDINDNELISSSYSTSSSTSTSTTSSSTSNKNLLLTNNKTTQTISSITPSSSSQIKSIKQPPQLLQHQEHVQLYEKKESNLKYVLVLFDKNKNCNKIEKEKKQESVCFKGYEKTNKIQPNVRLPSLKKTSISTSGKASSKCSVSISMKIKGY
jgi:hypothetical protein